MVKIFVESSFPSEKEVEQAGNVVSQFCLNYLLENFSVIYISRNRGFDYKACSIISILKSKNVPVVLFCDAPSGFTRYGYNCRHCPNKKELSTFCFKKCFRKENMLVSNQQFERRIYLINLQDKQRKHIEKLLQNNFSITDLEQIILKPFALFYTFLLREDFGSEILNLYFSIADPTDPLNPEREHTFLIAGPVTVLSRKDPELITIFSKPEEFLWFNNFPTNVLL